MSVGMIRLFCYFAVFHPGIMHTLIQILHQLNCLHTIALEDRFCAAAAVDGGDDLLVMTDNGTHPVQIHTCLPPHFLTHSHKHFNRGFYPTRLEEA